MFSAKLFDQLLLRVVPKIVMNKIIPLSLVIMMIFQANPGHANSPSPKQWQQFSIDTVQFYVLPRYQELYTASLALQESFTTLCETGDVAKTRQYPENV